MTWLAIWLGAAAVAVPAGFVAMIAKAQRHAAPCGSAGRRFAQAFLPALLAAAILTVLRSGRDFAPLPPVWLPLGPAPA